MITETYSNFHDAENDLAKFLFGKQLIEEIENELESISKTLLETKEVGKYEVDGCSKSLNVLMKKNSTIDSKVIDELTDEEIRKVFKPTETNLKKLGKKDLINKYKTITEVKSFKVEGLKG